jgi:hypothetical protein
MLRNIIRAVCTGLRSEAQALAAVRAACALGWDAEMNDLSRGRTEPLASSASTFEGLLLPRRPSLFTERPLDREVRRSSDEQVDKLVLVVMLPPRTDAHRMIRSPRTDQPRRGTNVQTERR